MQAKPKSSRQISSIARLGLSLLILLAAAYLFFNFQTIKDHLLAWQYQPSAAIAKMTGTTTMTEEAKLYFYASQPQIKDRQAFNQACKDVLKEKTAVLGCYNGRNIYLFNVTSDKLKGIKPVTAAHEMLHAAFDRLSSSERDRVKQLLEKQSQQIDSQDIKQLIELYAQTEPGAKYNELHSIFATQVKDLSPELENYYKQYFNDRSQVVAMYQSYHTVFSKLEAQQNRLLNQLEDLSASIDQLSSNYQAAVASYNRDVEQFNVNASSGQFSRAEYNRRLKQLQARQAELNNQRSIIEQKINNYKKIRQQLTAVNAQAVELNRSIDSSLPSLKEVE